MDNEFTDLELLRARAAQYGLKVVHNFPQWFIKHDGILVVENGLKYPDERQALEAACRLGALAMEANNA